MVGAFPRLTGLNVFIEVVSMESLGRCTALGCAGGLLCGRTPPPILRQAGTGGADGPREPSASAGSSSCETKVVVGILVADIDE